MKNLQTFKQFVNEQNLPKHTKKFKVITTNPSKFILSIHDGLVFPAGEFWRREEFDTAAELDKSIKEYKDKGYIQIK